ncbi:MAG: hypothetical protein WBA12_10360, partial [Catalinimonas sp.]
MTLGERILALKNRLKPSPADEPERRTTELATARRVGILAHVRHEADWQVVRRLQKRLAEPQREVRALLFLDYRPDDPALFSVPHFTTRDISLTGKIKVPEVATFVVTRFDDLL